MNKNRLFIGDEATVQTVIGRQKRTLCNGISTSYSPWK